MFSLISRFIENRKEKIRKQKADLVRNIPDSYFGGYRRLAETEEEIKPFLNTCSSCKHAICYMNWYCDLGVNSECEYEPCYTRDKITLADYMAGYRAPWDRNWIGLPSNQEVIKIIEIEEE